MLLMNSREINLITFDEFGKPNKEIDDFANQIEKDTIFFITKMIDEGSSAVDIRAISSYLQCAINCATSHAILTLAEKVHKDKQKNADPHLSAEETTSVRLGNKIDAIKKHRQRTGRGLKESKDAVDDYEKIVKSGLYDCTKT